jgi:UDP-N-acetylglucosamine 1-carboxyvinyltransferase
MDEFVIQGGRRLRGSVRIHGAKNAALPIMAASILSEGKVTLRGVPDLVDVRTLSMVLGELGVQAERTEDGALAIETTDETKTLASYDLVRRMRGSISVLGPLLARRGRAQVSLPGGCAIGDRPIDLHLKGLLALGADMRVEHGYVFAEAKKLRGAEIYLGGPFGSTVTGTINIMCAAAVAEGATAIENAACEPEVADCGEFLNAMGAKITGLGTPRILIQGVSSLGDADYEIIPDRIEAGTFIMAAGITNGDVVLENVRLEHLTAVVDVLKRVGLQFDREDGGVRVSCTNRLEPIDVTALPYPGFPTDLQAQTMALLATVEGISVITDKIFPDRFMHVAELNRMGAQIRKEGASALVHGVRALSGAEVMASDLRASAALVVAGMAAQGETRVRRIYHLDRGYQSLETKLATLGARIERVSDGD